MLEMNFEQRVICISEYEHLEVGKVYDMRRILYTDDNSYDLYNCIIFDSTNGNVWRAPLNIFETLSENRNKKIDNILDD